MITKQNWTITAWDTEILCGHGGNFRRTNITVGIYSKGTRWKPLLGEKQMKSRLEFANKATKVLADCEETRLFAKMKPILNCLSIISGENRALLIICPGAGRCIVRWGWFFSSTEKVKGLVWRTAEQRMWNISLIKTCFKLQNLRLE